MDLGMEIYRLKDLESREQDEKQKIEKQLEHRKVIKYKIKFCRQQQLLQEEARYYLDGNRRPVWDWVVSYLHQYRCYEKILGDKTTRQALVRGFVEKTFFHITYIERDKSLPKKPSPEYLF